MARKRMPKEQTSPFDPQPDKLKRAAVAFKKALSTKRSRSTPS